MASLHPQPTYLSCAQCRAVDRYAIEELGIPGVVLMENAGRNAAELIARWAGGRGRAGAGGRSRVAVVCGKGNNGGDGFVVARHLANRGWSVSVDLFGDPGSLSPDAAVNHAIASRMGIPIRRLAGSREPATAARRWSGTQVVVDALLGTGFSGRVQGPLAEVIARINALDGPLIVALDVPSGLDADRGRAIGEAVRADRTITFLAYKRGFRRPESRRWTGRVAVVDIGVSLGPILRRLRAGAGGRGGQISSSNMSSGTPPSS